MNKTLVILSAAVAMLTAGIAQAQNPTPKRIRGEIAAVTDTQLTIKERGGETLQVKLGEPLTVNAVIKADLASIAPGTYVGVASLPQSDGVLKAVEVLIFPDAMRGTGEGHFAWDLTPETMMTNATVETAEAQVSGRTLKLKYKDGEKMVIVPVDAPIVTFQPSDRSMLKTGAHVFMTAMRQPDGTLSASRVAVGKDGLVPPM